MSAEGPRFDSHIASAPDYSSGTSVEEAARRSGITDVVRLASNENPLGPSRRAVAAIRDAAARLHLYPPMADDALRARCAAVEGAGVAADHIITGSGGSDVLGMIAAGLLEPGDEAVICPPTFALYEILIRRRGARAVRCDLLRPGFAYDPDAILRAVTPATRVVFLCSPVNPTGTLLTADAAARIMAGLPDRVVVVFDESYRDFVDDPAAADVRAFVRAGRFVIGVHSLSKSYGLAGLRVGYGVTHPELARYLRRLRNPFALSSLQLAGALAALDDRAHLARTCRTVRRERAWLCRELDRRGLAPTPSQANFVLFEPGLRPELVHERLLQRGVVVRPAAFFYLPAHVRVTVGTRAHNRRFLTELDDVLAGALQESRA